MHRCHRVLVSIICWIPWCPRATPHPAAMLCPGAHRVLVPHPCATLCDSACHGLVAPTVAWFPQCPRATPRPGATCSLVAVTSWNPWCPHATPHPRATGCPSARHGSHRVPVPRHSPTALHPHGHRVPMPSVSSCLGTRRLVLPRPRPCHVASPRPRAAPAGPLPLLGDSWWPPTQELLLRCGVGAPRGLGCWGLLGVPGAAGGCPGFLGVPASVSPKSLRRGLGEQPGVDPGPLYP